MDVKEGVGKAVAVVRELFQSEDISDVGLEEIEYDPAFDQWLVTIGFSRPWDRKPGGLAVLTGADVFPRRSYKVVRLDRNGTLVSVKDRE